MMKDIEGIEEEEYRPWFYSDYSYDNVDCKLKFEAATKVVEQLKPFQGQVFDDVKQPIDDSLSCAVK